MRADQSGFSLRTYREYDWIPGPTWVAAAY